MNLRSEGLLKTHYLVDYSTEGPDIDLLVVDAAIELLGWHEFLGSTHCLMQATLDDCLTHAEVNQLAETRIC